jgi:hypothetical protein
VCCRQLIIRYLRDRSYRAGKRKHALTELAKCDESSSIDTFESGTNDIRSIVLVFTSGTATTKLVTVHLLECKSQEPNARHLNCSNEYTLGNNDAVAFSEYQKHPTCIADDHAHFDESSSSPERNCKCNPIAAHMAPM